MAPQNNSKYESTSLYETQTTAIITRRMLPQHVKNDPSKLQMKYKFPIIIAVYAFQHPNDEIYKLTALPEQCVQILYRRKASEHEQHVRFSLS